MNVKVWNLNIKLGNVKDLKTIIVVGICSVVDYQPEDILLLFNFEYACMLCIREWDTFQYNILVRFGCFVLGYPLW
jgi:hypothetical protein